MRSALFIALSAGIIAGCSTIRPQRGGVSTATLGGTNLPTTVVNTAPENPQTPSNTSIEKTTTRVYQLPSTQTATANTQGVSAGEQRETGPRSAAAQSESSVVGAPVQGASPAMNVSGPGAAAPGAILRETVTERVTTQTGSAQKDTARELGVRLQNTRGVMWVGVLLLIVGPIVGWKLGWFTNGCIAGGVGLLLIILSTIIPGNEVWFGLGGLLVLPLVGYVYYRGHFDAKTLNPFVAPTSAADPKSPPAA